MYTLHSNYVLETTRLTLRPLVEVHLEQLMQILSDPDIAKGLLGDISTPENLEQTARIWPSDALFWETNQFGIWGVFDHSGTLAKPDVLLGVAGADEPPPAVGEGPESYYFFAQQVWGKGVASEAMSAVCAYLFETIQVAAVEALIFAELNPGSVRLAMKLGMRSVGRVHLIGHHLSKERAFESIAFDLWRVRTSSPTRARDTLEEAAFRIGQLIGEGVSNKPAATDALLHSAQESGINDVIGDSALRDLIEQRLTNGMQVPGLAHYRVRRNEWANGTYRRPHSSTVNAGNT